ncbi:DUF4214 domain-containing protein [Desulfobotulus mexicanus]|nr:DUF4214 domain-containing protein [Desulfobotulus mexicanus]
MQSAAQGMVETDAAEEFYGDKYDDDAAFVEMLYLNTMNKAPDAEGLDHWVASLEGGASRGEVAAEFIAAIEDNKEIDPVGYATFNNRVAVSDYTADKVPGEDLKVSELDEFVGYVSEVTDDESTVAAAKEKVDADVPDPGVPGETITLTAGKDIILAADAELPDGLTEDDVVRSTDNNDTIKGILDNQPSKNTLDTSDEIDGGAGNNTLQVEMGKNFSGFSGSGFMKNVETVELTNNVSFARNLSFSSKGTEGVTTYVLNPGQGSIALNDVQSAEDLTVKVNDQKSGDLNIVFASGKVSGLEDSMDLAVKNVGSAAQHFCNKADIAQQNVTVKAVGIEHTTVNLEGNNYLNLAQAASKTLTFTGEGSASITAVAPALSAFDASSVNGKITADLTDVTQNRLQDIKFSKGNLSQVEVNATSLNIAANIEGSTAGLSVLKINHGAGNHTLAPVMKDVEAAVFVGTAASANINFVGAGVTGLAAVTIAGTGNRTFADMVNNDTMTIKAANNAQGNVVYDGFGVLNVQTVAPTIALPCCSSSKLGEIAPTNSNLTVNSINASLVNVDIVAHSRFGGEVQINSLESDMVTLNVASAKATADITAVAVLGTPAFVSGEELTAFTGTLSASHANSVLIDAAGDIGQFNFTDDNVFEGFGTAADAAEMNFAKAQQLSGKVANANIKLIAPDLETIDLSGVRGYALITEDSSLASLESVSAVGITGVLSIAAEMESLASATFVGSGAVDLTGATIEGTDSGFLNGAIATDGTDADSFISDMSLGDATAAGSEALNVDYDASALTGRFAVSVAEYNGTGSTASVTGSRISTNFIEVEARDTITVRGGSSSDYIGITLNEGGTATLTGGAGRDIFEVAGTSGENSYVLIEDFVAGRDVLLGATDDGWQGVTAGSTAGDVDATAMSSIADDMNGFDRFSNITATDIKVVAFAADGSSTANTVGVLYNNDVWVIADGTNNEMLIQLQGLTNYELIA